MAAPSDPRCLCTLIILSAVHLNAFNFNNLHRRDATTCTIHPITHSTCIHCSSTKQPTKQNGHCTIDLQIIPYIIKLSKGVKNHYRSQLLQQRIWSSRGPSASSICWLREISVCFLLTAEPKCNINPSICLLNPTVYSPVYTPNRLWKLFMSLSACNWCEVWQRELPTVTLHNWRLNN